MTREEGGRGGPGPGLAWVVTGLRLVGDRRPGAVVSPSLWGRCGLGAPSLLPPRVSGLPEGTR